jgi:hypothetical protein
MSNIPAFSSLGRSIEAYQPYYAPPTFPQTNYIQTGSALNSVNPPVYTPGGYANGAVVRSVFRNVGMRILYKYGAATKSWFKSIATGQVESTKFQPWLASMQNAFANDSLYQAGFPRNLGWSEKVPTIPPEALGISPNQMAARPRPTRNIYTRRSFATAPSIPAVPYNGRSS